MESWPDRFIYVCGAGSAMSVNLLPLANAGRDRVAGIIIMSAVVDKNNPTPAEKAQAIGPTDRIIRYAVDVLGFSIQDMRVRNGHPDKFSDWLDILNEAADWAAESDAEIVFNVTGGRTASKIGPLLGARKDGLSKLSVLLVGTSPLGITLVRSNGRDGIEEIPMPVVRRWRIEEYLSAYGAREINSEARIERHWQLSAAGTQPMSMLRTAARNGVGKYRKAFGALYAAIPPKTRKLNRNNWSPKEFRINRSELDLLVRSGLFENIDGITWDRDGAIRVETFFAFEYIAGKWLEAALLHRVESSLARRNDVEIIAGLEFGLEGSGKKTVSEFDIAVLSENSLTLIEAKAVVSPAGLQGDVAKLANHRDRFCGPTGRAFIVCPLLSRDDVEAAKRDGVEVMFGPSAVDMTVKKITRALG